MSGSILNDTKAALGIGEQDAFDQELIISINSVLSDLDQLGVGPTGGVEIQDDSAEWTIITGDNPKFNSVKSYVSMRVRLLFDPPDQSWTQTSIKEQIEKAEFRLMVAADPAPTVDGVEPPAPDIILDGGDI
jgi:hypothetical protein